MTENSQLVFFHLFKAFDMKSVQSTQRKHQCLLQYMKSVQSTPRKHQRYLHNRIGTPKVWFGIDLNNMRFAFRQRARRIDATASIMFANLLWHSVEVIDISKTQGGWHSYVLYNILYYIFLWASVEYKPEGLY